MTHIAIVLLIAAFAWAESTAEVQLRTVNGTVVLRESEDERVHVATRGIHTDPEAHVETRRKGGRLTICETYRSRLAPDARCEAERSELGIPDRNQRVDFDVAVPRNVPVILETINGAVEGSASGSARVTTINGNVHLINTADAVIRTTNGNTAVSVGCGSLTIIDSTNGDVTINAAADTGIDLTAKSLSRVFRESGSMTLQRRLGNGCARVQINGGSGAIEIRHGTQLVRTR